MRNAQFVNEFTFRTNSAERDSNHCTSLITKTVNAEDGTIPQPIVCNRNAARIRTQQRQSPRVRPRVLRTRHSTHLPSLRRMAPSGQLVTRLDGTRRSPTVDAYEYDEVRALARLEREF